MGICGAYSLSTYDGNSLLPNPNPSNFAIERVAYIFGNLVAMVRYPDCTNYEGVKILLFYDMTETELRSMKVIDPHFSESCPQKSPIARFIPNESGWKMACCMAQELGWP